MKISISGSTPRAGQGPAVDHYFALADGCHLLLDERTVVGVVPGPASWCRGPWSARRPVMEHHRSFTKTARHSASLCTMPTRASWASRPKRASGSARAA